MIPYEYEIMQVEDHWEVGAVNDELEWMCYGVYPTREEAEAARYELEVD